MFLHSTARGRKSLYTLQWAILSQKIAPYNGVSGPIKFMIHWARASPQSKLQMASRSVQLFSHKLPQSVLWFTMGDYGPLLPPSYCPFSWGDLDPNLIRGSLGPAGSSDLNPNDISIGSPVLHLRTCSEGDAVKFNFKESL